MAVDLRIFNTVRFRRGHRAEDWQGRNPGELPVQANRYPIRSGDEERTVIINLLECLADDSSLASFDPPPDVVLHLEYFDGKRWVGATTTDDARFFDRADFEDGATNDDFTIEQPYPKDAPNTLRVKVPKITIAKNKPEKYRIRVELTQTIPDIEPVTNVGSGIE